jgi:hypothetical protein
MPVDLVFVGDVAVDAAFIALAGKLYLQGSEARPVPEVFVKASNFWRQSMVPP